MTTYEVLPTFHSQEGLYFQRYADGGVRVFFRDPTTDQVTVSVSLAPNTWASVVASMSCRGESHETFNAALDFHQIASRGVQR